MFEKVGMCYCSHREGDETRYCPLLPLFQLERDGGVQISSSWVVLVRHLKLETTFNEHCINNISIRD